MNRFFFDAAPRCATCSRGAIGWVLALALLLLPGIVGCQMPPGNSAMLDEVAKRLQTVKEEMATKPELAAFQDANVRAHNDLSARFGQLQTTVGQLGTKVDQEVCGRLDKAEAGLRDANQRLAAAENSAAIANNYTDWRLRNLEEGGRHSTYQAGYGYTPDAAPALPSPPQPQPTSPSWGVVKVENNMTTWQYMEVNGVATGIAPGTSVSIRVSPGWATTRLIGYEGPKSWWVGAPSYVQRVVIAPKPAYDSVVQYP